MITEPLTATPLMPRKSIRVKAETEPQLPSKILRILMPLSYQSWPASGLRGGTLFTKLSVRATRFSAMNCA